MTEDDPFTAPTPEPQADPFEPTTDAAADLVVSRSPDANAIPQSETVAPAQSDDTVLNAASKTEPTVAPSVATQRTGTAAETYRAPSMTRDSAINLLEVRWGEMVTMLRDFDHDTDGLPDDLVALVDFVKSRYA